MESIRLDTPEGIDVALGWDPQTSEHDRKRILARQLVSARLGVEERAVIIEREAPAQFGFHTQLHARVGAEPVQLQIRTASHRAATVCAVAAPDVVFGVDLRDTRPDETTLGDMKRGSHLLDENDLEALIAHWTRVQAIRVADGRGVRVRPDHVRLDANLRRGWVPDRGTQYALADLSRDGWVITLAYHLPES